jgi:hypothetical protein
MSDFVAKTNKAGNYVLEAGPHQVIINPATGRISIRSSKVLILRRFNEFSDSNNVVIDVADFDNSQKEE